ncbi:MAG: LacI family transcriptional regulator [Clostridiales bacterium]|jgi:LacI family transcriptional regulator|nr:LacI family transcriptional regulator [Clostridiales bacterium]
MDKKATIYQIAEQAGVSITTVSRVLNNSPLVTEQTKELVRAVINKNHYSPNAMARGLSLSKSKTIGVILPDITNPYFSALFIEIERYALEHDYSVLLYNTLYGSFSHSFSKTFDECDYFQMCVEKRLDGVIITGGQLDKDDISKEYKQSVNELCKSLPVVIIGQEIKGIDCLFIQRGLAKGIEILTEHLRSLGHQKIGFIGGEPGVRVTSERFNAYKDALKQAGLPYNPSYVHFSDYYVNDGYKAMQNQLKAERPTALIAINDMVAFGALRAMTDAGVAVPEDMALVSCDEFFFGAYTVPRFTSLNQQNDYLGQLAIVNLIKKINGQNDDKTVIVHEPKLVVRESCGKGL